MDIGGKKYSERKKKKLGPKAHSRGWLPCYKSSNLYKKNGADRPVHYLCIEENQCNSGETGADKREVTFAIEPDIYYKNDTTRAGKSSS